MNMGTLQQLYALILPLGYMDNQEYAADRWAYQQLIRLDGRRYEALKFLRKARGLCRPPRIQQSVRAPTSPVRAPPWSTTITAHTAVWRRLNELEAATAPSSTKP